MSLPQVYELFGYWQRSPPVHELVAAFVGYKYEKPREIKGDDAGGFPIHELFADIDMVNNRG